MRALYEACKLASVKHGGWLNGSCKVLSMEGDTLDLGFWNQMHMNKVDTEVRPLVEEQASVLLKRPIKLQVTLLPPEQAANRRAARSGHLAEAARQLGAKPVEKG